MKLEQISALLALTFACACACRAEETLCVIAPDAGVKIEEKRNEASGSLFKGPLPEGWTDNYTPWTKSVARSEIAVENGKKIFRIDVEKLDRAVQFERTLPEMELAPYDNYRLDFKIRVDGQGVGTPVSFNVRERPAPYALLYSAVAPATEGRWCERSLHFRLKTKPAAPLALYLQIVEKRRVDIAFVRLTKLTEAEVAAEIPRPPSGLKNLFRNSRLPLGLQAGWNLSRELETGSAEPDEKTPGPDGIPTLKLESNSDKELTLFSEPFQTPDPKARHSVSLAVKGEGKWTLAVMADGKELAKASFAPGADWRREKVEFTPSLTEKSFALKISGAGRLWIDRLKACAASEGDGYASQGECETALALPKSEASDARIQFDGEPSKTLCFASGDLAGATLKARAFNIYGAEKALPDIELLPESLWTKASRRLGLASEKSAFATWRGELDYGVFPETPFGQFRVETWIERDGERISPFNEFVATRIRKPVFWGEDAPNSPFGCHMLPSPSTLTAMKAAGVNWTRLLDAGSQFTSWRGLEPSKGKWTFSDAEIKRYRDAKIKILGFLGATPRWASYASKTTSQTAFFDLYFLPLDMAEFSVYVKTAVSHYKGQIDEYFVWNEPWSNAFWAVDYGRGKKGASSDGYVTSANPPADYVRLVETAWKAAKEADPSVKIVGFNTRGGDVGAKWTKGVLDAGGLDSCDIIDCHIYGSWLCGYPGDAQQKALATALEPAIAKDGRLVKPLYISEGQGAKSDLNSPAGNGSLSSGLYKRVLPAPSNEDYVKIADFNCKFFVGLLACGAAKVFVYSAHAYQNLGAPADFSVLLGGDGYPHPALAATSNMAWNLEGRRYVKCVPLAENVWAFVFEGRGGSAAAVSGKSPSGNWRIPASNKLRASDLFGNPLASGTPYRDTIMFIESDANADELAKALTE